MFGLTYSQWVTNLRQDFSRRRKLGLLMSASGSSSWLTPKMPNGGRSLSREEVDTKGATDHGKITVDLGSQVRHWPTPHGLAADHGPDGNEFAKSVRSWPTPTCADADRASLTYSHGANNPTLTGAARTWPTPTTQDGENNGPPSQAARNSPPLNVLATQWPTPKGREGHQWDSPGSARHSPDLSITSMRWRDAWQDPGWDSLEHSRPALVSEANGHECSSTCLRLNPLFVGWLMGFPAGWTNCDASVTLSFPSWLRTHSERLLAVAALQANLGW